MPSEIGLFPPFRHLAKVEDFQNALSPLADAGIVCQASEIGIVSKLLCNFRTNPGVVQSLNGDLANLLLLSHWPTIKAQGKVMMYFNGLNYTLANEDTRVEREVLGDLKSVTCVAGSGARVLPLMKPTVEKIHIVDISKNQLELARLRIKAAQVLPLIEYQELLGYQPSRRRLSLFHELELNSQEKSFWLATQEHWVPAGWIFAGKWESHLRKLGIAFRTVFGLDFSAVFELGTQEERQEWMLTHWPRRRLDLFLKVFANPWMMNKFLYQGRFAQGEEPFPRFLLRTFESMLTEKNPRQSFFLQMLFLGEIRYLEGAPIEVHADVHSDVQKFEGEILFKQTDLIEHLFQQQSDFVSLSDVPSYLSRNDIFRLESALQTQFEGSRGAWVARSFLSHPAWSREVEMRISKQKNAWAEEVDTTGVYKFHIFENLSA